MSKCEDCMRLEARQQELLATIVRLTNETPFPDEIKGWEGQRARLVAEVGTLRSALSAADLRISVLEDCMRSMAEIIDRAGMTGTASALRKLVGEK